MITVEISPIHINGDGKLCMAVIFLGEPILFEVLGYNESGSYKLMRL